MHQTSKQNRRRSKQFNRAVTIEYNDRDDKNNSSFKLKLSLEANNFNDYENIEMKHSRTFENKIINHEFKSIFSMLDPLNDEKSPDSKGTNYLILSHPLEYPKIRIGNSDELRNVLHPIEPENEDIQYQIEQINKELQEEDDYLDIDNDESSSSEEEVVHKVEKPKPTILESKTLTKSKYFMRITNFRK